MTDPDATFRVGDRVYVADEEHELFESEGVVTDFTEEDAHLNGRDGRAPGGPFGDPRPHYNVLFDGTADSELVPEDVLEAG